MRFVLVLALLSAPTFALKASVVDEPKMEDIPLEEVQLDLSEPEKEVTPDDTVMQESPDDEEKKVIVNEETPEASEEEWDKYMTQPREDSEAPGSEPEENPVPYVESSLDEVDGEGFGRGQQEEPDEPVPKERVEAEDQGASDEIIMMAPKRRNLKQEREDRMLEEAEKKAEERERQQEEWSHHEGIVAEYEGPPVRFDMDSLETMHMNRKDGTPVLSDKPDDEIEIDEEGNEVRDARELPDVDTERTGKVPDMDA